MSQGVHMQKQLPQTTQNFGQNKKNLFGAEKQPLQTGRPDSRNGFNDEKPLDYSSTQEHPFPPRFHEESRQLFDNMQLPNDSMTLSALSQSPWQGRTTSDVHRRDDDTNKTEGLRSFNMTASNLRGSDSEGSPQQESGRDSPHFNRGPQAMTQSSYQAFQPFRSSALGDSVGQSSFLENSHNQMSHVGGLLTRRDATLITNNNNISEEDEEEEDRESNLGSSDISGLEDFQRTQTNGAWMQSRSQVKGTVKVEGRSPVSNMRGFNHTEDSDLALTPESVSQASYIQKKFKANAGTNRTQGSEGLRKSSNMHQNPSGGQANLTQRVKQPSLQRDPELDQALSEETELRQGPGQLERQVNTLKLENQRLVTRLGEKERELQINKQALVQNQVQLQELQFQCQDQEAHIKMLGSKKSIDTLRGKQLQQSENERKQLMAQFKDLERKYKQNLQEFQSQQQIHSEDINSYKQALEALQGKCDSESALIRAQKNEIKQFEARAQREVETLHQQIAQLAQARDHADNQFRFKEDELNKGEKRIQQLANELQTLQTAKGRVDERLQVTQSELKEFKRKCKELEDNYTQSKLPSENSGYLANKGGDYGAKDVYNQYQQELKKQQMKLKTANERTKDLEKQLEEARANSGNENTQEELQSLRETETAVRAQLRISKDQSISEKIEEIQEEQKLYDSEIHKQQKWISQLEQEKEQLAHMVQQRDQAKTDHSYYDKVLQEKDKDLKQRTAAIKTLEEAVREKENLVSELNQSYRELQSFNKQLEERTKMLENQVELLKGQNLRTSLTQDQSPEIQQLLVKIQSLNLEQNADGVLNEQMNPNLALQMLENQAKVQKHNLFMLQEELNREQQLKEEAENERQSLAQILKKQSLELEQAQIQIQQANEKLQTVITEKEQTDKEMQKLLKLQGRIGGGSSNNTEKEVLDFLDALIDPSSEKAIPMNTFSRFHVDLSAKLAQLRSTKAPQSDATIQTEEQIGSEAGDLENCDPHFIARWLKDANSSQRKKVQEEVLKQSGSSEGKDLLEDLVPQVDLESSLEHQTLKAKSDLAEQKVQRLTNELEALKREKKSKEAEIKEKQNEWLHLQNQSFTEIQTWKMKEQEIREQLESSRLSSQAELQNYKQQNENLKLLVSKMKQEQDMEKTKMLSSIEGNKEQVQCKIKELEENHNFREQELTERHSEQIESIRQDYQKANDEIKRQKERQTKQHKEELERNKKMAKEKLERQKEEHEAILKNINQECEIKVEEANSKAKKDIKNQQDKVKAEQRNLLDQVKNEVQKKLADFERENQPELDSWLIKQEEAARKQAKQPYWKEVAQNISQSLLQKLSKKTEEKELQIQEFQSKTEKEMKEFKNTQIRKLNSDKEAQEKKLRLTLTEQITQQLREELKERENELREQCSVQTQTLRQLKESKEVQVMTITAEDFVTPAKTENSLSPNTQETPATEECRIIDAGLMQKLQLKEQEMQRQQKLFTIQLDQKGDQTLRIFEELMRLEFDKVQKSLQKRDQDETYRKQVNGMIADILKKNEGQMKSTLEVLKKSLSEVLRRFKTEMDSKFEKRLQEERSKIEDAFSESEQQRKNIEQFEALMSQEEKLTPVKAAPKETSEEQHQSAPRSHRRNEQNLTQKSEGLSMSDIQSHLQEAKDLEADPLLKVAPLQIQNGNYVLHMEKAAKDLALLYEQFCQSKFFGFLNSESQPRFEITNEPTKDYRVIMNSFFRQFTALNNQIDKFASENDACRQRLINTELRKEIAKLQHHAKSDSIGLLCEQILDHFSQNCFDFSEDTQMVYNALEQASFDLNKLHLRLFQLVKVFVDENEKPLEDVTVVNEMVAQIESNDLRQSLFGAISGNLLTSQNSPEGKLLSPELLSPDETAQLLSNIFQRFKAAEAPQGPQNPFNPIEGNHLASQNSFFQTFLSNEEYIKSAETFINKFRQYKTSNSVNLGKPLLARKRSQESLVPGLQLTQTQGEKQKQVTNCFASKNFDSMHSVASQLPFKTKPGAIHSHYASQQSMVTQKNVQSRSSSQNKHSTITAYPNCGGENDELEKAKENVNQLFNRMRRAQE